MSKPTFTKFAEGLNDAVLVTKLSNAILDLLPSEVVTRDLHSRIIVLLAPHVSAELDEKARK